MSHPPSIPPSRYLPATLAVATPAILVLFVLAFLRLMPFWAFLLAGLVVFAATALLIHRHLADLLAAEALVRSLDDANHKSSYRPERGWAASLIAQLFRLRENWSRELRRQYAIAGTYETVLDSLPDPLLLLDDKRRVVRANLTARKLFGRNLRERDLAQFLRDPDVLEAVDAVLAGTSGQEVPFESAGTVARIFLARIEPLPVKALDNAVALLTFHDITALKRTEQMRADFVANASHELRTPLATLSGFIETLQGPAKDDREAHEKFLAIMYEQTSRMSRLVQDLLSLSRVELNELTPPTDSVDLGKLLSSVTDGLAINAKAKEATLSLSLPPDLPLVTGAADELTQIFQNLIDNAIKYGKRGGNVSVEVQRVEKGPMTMGPEARLDCVSVAVIDQGEGIGREHLPRLTERFYRVDTARSRALGGTGLGLAIVKHIVNRHRGALQIESALGVGSRFTVFLPRFHETGSNA
ncbi:putative two-component sensor histidine kinase, classical system [Rhodospirillaceae bacterium LM-1]|nr:putative two-component sensor histidine kinase, classical system [Rhodospirillaceae bacterium LM-1]